MIPRARASQFSFRRLLASGGLALTFATWGLAQASSDPVYDALIERALTADPDFFDKPFEAAVSIKANKDQIEETIARIEVRQTLAALAQERKNLPLASSHLGHAVKLARHLADADWIIRLSLKKAHIDLARGERFVAESLGKSVWDIAQQLDRREDQVAAGLVLARFKYASGDSDQLPEFFDTILALKPANRLEVLRLRAELSSHGPRELQQAYWQATADASEAEGDSLGEARAWDKLGLLAAETGDTQQALENFERADQAAPLRQRSSVIWRKHVEIVSQRDNQAAARAVVDRALVAIDENEDAALAADLHDALSALDAAARDYKSAYQSLRHAQGLRDKPINFDKIPRVLMSSTTPINVEAEAAELAAVRNALRESELAATQLRQRNTYVLVIASLMLAGLLGVAYHFKRRAAEALAEARDAAELRAERTHWEMLRYQLNPHFLFNALTSVSGLAMVDPEATRQTVNRLSQFCRLALERTTGQLRSIEDEMKLLSAFLDVEKVGMGDRLEINLHHDPRTADWLLPPLFLQPLVENALKYGSRTSGDDLKVAIRVEMDPSNAGILIEVANTGEWVEEQSVKRRRRKVGLANVRERLQRIAPQNAQLSTVASDGWVKIQIRLPDLRDHVLAVPAPV
ncbi:MAG: hypothetical protein SynsKO_40070 [Synoicihabitans sp.]